MRVSNPYGNDPYGNSAGQNPYGSPSPYGGGAEATKTDGVSIASFVLSLLCCTGLIGLILGFVGLSRTKGGKRKGRWAAIAGIIIGLLATLGLIGGGAFVIWFAETSVTIDEAEVGQCLNIREDGDTVYLTDKDCSEDHDGEIVHTGVYKDIEEANLMPTDINDLADAAISQAVCSSLMDPADVADLPTDLEWGLALSQDAVDDPADDDKFICYVTSAKKLDESLL